MTTMTPPAATLTALPTNTQRFVTACALITRSALSTVTYALDLYPDGTLGALAHLCGEDNEIAGYEPVTPATIQRYLVLSSNGAHTWAETLDTDEALHAHLQRLHEDEPEVPEWVVAVFDLDRAQPITVAVQKVVTVTTTREAGVPRPEVAAYHARLTRRAVG